MIIESAVTRQLEGILVVLVSTIFLGCQPYESQSHPEDSQAIPGEHPPHPQTSQDPGASRIDPIAALQNTPVTTTWPQDFSTWLPENTGLIATIRLSELERLEEENRQPHVDYWAVLGFPPRESDPVDFYECLRTNGMDLTRPLVVAQHPTHMGHLDDLRSWGDWLLSGRNPPFETGDRAVENWWNESSRSWLAEVESADCPPPSAERDSPWSRLYSNAYFHRNAAAGIRIIVPTYSNQAALALIDGLPRLEENADHRGSEYARVFDLTDRFGKVGYLFVREASEHLILDAIVTTSPLEQTVVPPLENDAPNPSTLAPTGDPWTTVAVDWDSLITSSVATNWLELANAMSSDFFLRRERIESGQTPETVHAIAEEIRHAVDLLWSPGLPVTGWILEAYRDRTILRIQLADPLPDLATASISPIELPGFTGLQISPGVLSVNAQSWTMESLALFAPDRIREVLEMLGFAGSYGPFTLPVLGVRVLLGLVVGVPDLAAANQLLDSVLVSSEPLMPTRVVGLLMVEGVTSDQVGALLACLDSSFAPGCGTPRGEWNPAGTLGEESVFPGWRFSVAELPRDRRLVWLEEGEGGVDLSGAHLNDPDDSPFLGALLVDLDPLLASDDQRSTYLAEFVSGLSGRDRFNIRLTVDDHQLVWTLPFVPGERTTIERPRILYITNLEVAAAPAIEVPDACVVYTDRDGDGRVDSILTRSFDQLGRPTSERVDILSDPARTNYREFEYNTSDTPDERPSRVLSDIGHDGQWDHTLYIQYDDAGRVILKADGNSIEWYSYQMSPDHPLWLVDRLTRGESGWSYEPVVDVLPVEGQEREVYPDREYDEHGRLVRMPIRSGYPESPVMEYEYDEVGNLTREVQRSRELGSDSRVFSTTRYDYGCWHVGTDGELDMSEIEPASANPVDFSAYPPAPELISSSSLVPDLQSGIRRHVAAGTVPRVYRDQVSLQGPLTQAQVDRVVRGHGRGIRYCYERRLRDEPDLTGVITAEWTIDTAGHVSDIGLEPSALELVHDCLTRELGRMRFPEESGATRVMYPLIFLTEE